MYIVKISQIVSKGNYFISGQIGKSVDICENRTLEAGIVSLHSPGYPNQYPAEMDCRCEVTIRTDGAVLVNFQVCGAIMGNNKGNFWHVN